MYVFMPGFECVRIPWYHWDGEWGIRTHDTRHPGSQRGDVSTLKIVTFNI